MYENFFLRVTSFFQLTERAWIFLSMEFYYGIGTLPEYFSKSPTLSLESEMAYPNQFCLSLFPVLPSDESSSMKTTILSWLGGYPAV